MATSKPINKSTKTSKTSISEYEEGRSKAFGERIFAVLKILEETNEEAPVTATQIVTRLGEDFGIDVERRTVYRDIKALVNQGYDIVLSQDNKAGYYLCSREFEDWEVKVLVDAVSRAKFLSPKVSQSLALRLVNLVSEKSKAALNRATVVTSPRKQINNMTQFNIDSLLTAISKGYQVSFDYCYHDEKLRLVPRQNSWGGKYVVNPYTLIWNEDFYYLICNFKGYRDLSYYRLDKITNIEICNDDRGQPVEALSPKELLGHDYQEKIKSFVETSIYNYGSSKKITLVLQVKPFMVDYLFDLFGSSILRIEKFQEEGQGEGQGKVKSESSCEKELGFKEEWAEKPASFSWQKNQGAKGEYLVYVDASLNEGLYFLLLQFGPNIKVIGPDEVVKTYLEKLETIIGKYK